VNFYITLLEDDVMYGCSSTQLEEYCSLDAYNDDLTGVSFEYQWPCCCFQRDVLFRGSECSVHSAQVSIFLLCGSECVCDGPSVSSHMYDDTNGPSASLSTRGESRFPKLGVRW
jgi:hypothetical protein